MADLENLLDVYFALGVAEGHEGRTHDTVGGDAQRVRSAISDELERMRERNLLANNRADNLHADLEKARALALEEAIDAVKRSNAPENIRADEFTMIGPLGILSRACAAIRSLGQESKGGEG